jgi:hypothetical protein
MEDAANRLRPPVARMVKFRTLWLPQCLNADDMTAIADTPDSWLLELYSDIYQYGPHVHKTLTNLTRMQQVLLSGKSLKFRDELRALTHQNEKLIERVYLNWYDLVKERMNYNNKAFKEEPIPAATVELLTKKYEQRVPFRAQPDSARHRFASQRTANIDIHHMATLMLCSDIVLNGDKADSMSARYQKFCKKWGLTP